MHIIHIEYCIEMGSCLFRIAQTDPPSTDGINQMTCSACSEGVSTEGCLQVDGRFQMWWPTPPTQLQI